MDAVLIEESKLQDYGIKELVFWALSAFVHHGFQISCH